MLWVTECGFEAANGYQINSGLQGKPAALCSVIASPAARAAISFQVGQLGGNVVPEGAAALRDSRPGCHPSTLLLAGHKQTFPQPALLSSYSFYPSRHLGAVRECCV